ncbi:hypothetical protein [Oceanobacillus damuensis]|uniref:hypothetical protein n=1 Tax=Oceanobacillus damuensis TaxID=937928 RepID=UPI000A6D9477|nr:hypothetical protein [Oceanobacillus damuensis]
MEVNDVLIIGSGVATLQLANLLSDDKNVKLITKLHMEYTNSAHFLMGVLKRI